MCRKVYYPTEHAAQVALVGAVVKRNRGSVRRRESRTYQCPQCGGFHLTSKPYRAQEDA